MTVGASDDAAELDVVLLCGGRGARAHPATLELPKPLMEIGGRPVVEHVMGIFAAQGHTRFLLASGYKHELLADRFRTPPPGLSVEVVDTGLETLKGERVRMVAPLCRGNRFLLSYADGLGNVDLSALIAGHEQHRAGATVTTVPLPSQYGTLVTDADGRVTEFLDYPVLPDHWINAGFMVVERDAIEGLSGDLEHDMLPELAGRGRLFAHRHRGFWKSMDTEKDRHDLDALLEGRPAPWLDPS